MCVGIYYCSIIFLLFFGVVYKKNFNKLSLKIFDEVLLMIVGLDFFANFKKFNSKSMKNCSCNSSNSISSDFTPAIASNTSVFYVAQWV